MKRRNFFKALLNRLKGVLTRNLGLKIVALVFAVLLWAYVLVAMNPVRSKSIDDVPITLEGYTDLLSRDLILVNSDLGLADVEVNATITNHSELDASRIICRASLGTISSAGTYRLPLSVTVQSNLGTVANVAPRTVTVEVDNLVRKIVPVSLELTGTLPEGYEVVSENVTNTITLEGAARYIEPAVRAVATVDLTGRTEDIQESVNVTFYDKDDNELTVVTRSKNAPNVTVRLTLSAFKRVTVQPDVTLADDTYFNLKSEVTPTTVIVYGSAETLADIESVSTEPVVLSAEAEIVSQVVPLALPDGVTLRPGQSGSVTLTATVTEKTGERTLEVPLTYLHLKNDVKLADGAPTYMTVTAVGSLRQLEQLTPEMFTIQADLSSFGTGEWELVPVLQWPSTGKFPNVNAALQEPRIQVTLVSVAVENTDEETP